MNNGTCKSWRKPRPTCEEDGVIDIEGIDEKADEEEQGMCIRDSGWIPLQQLGKEQLVNAVCKEFTHPRSFVRDGPWRLNRPEY